MNKRPMLIITISYIIGILLGLYLEINIALFCVVAIVISLFVFGYAKLVLKANTTNIVFVLFCIIIILFSTIMMHYKENRFSSLLEEIAFSYKDEFDKDNSEDELAENLEYIGTVISIQEESQYYQNYIVKMERINGDEKFKNINVLVKIKKFQNNKLINLEYGDVISGIGDFEEPSQRRNYKGYDYSQYLKTKNVYSICISNMKEVHVLKKNSLFVVNMWISKLRNLLKLNLLKLLPGESANIAIAFLLGDSSLIDEEQRQIFSDASLSHILAISGMHVSYVIFGFNFILKKFDKRKSKYFLIAFLLFFSQLSGGAPSIIRAVIMSSLMIASKLVYRKSDTINNISIACFIILLLNPYYILNLGFQLSFLGTLGIVLLNKRVTEIFDKCISVFTGYFRKNKEGVKYESNDLDVSILYKPFIKICKKICLKIKSILIIGISANILIFPVLVYNFNSISLIFLISNIFVTPILGVMSLVGYVTMILSLISMRIAVISCIPLHFCIEIFNVIAEICSSFSFARFTVITPSITTIMVYYILTVYVFYFYHKNHNKIILKVSVIVVILVSIVNFTVSYNAGLKLYFIDVGQGDSTLIVTSCNKRILIDGGGSDTSSYNVGERVLVPYLLDRKIMTIDYMFFSHFDSDHCKGLFTVMEKLKVRNAVISEQGEVSENYKYFIELVQEKQINVICVQARR